VAENGVNIAELRSELHHAGNRRRHGSTFAAVVRTRGNGDQQLRR
jgi:hypothetical protein